ncbi:hypothetical protein SH661x_001961 [Planctomicrobium sp. SH661]|uniref:hypothetical protein n=1 Tax=Planctomicrobium sp. SH661 TaxID=3448124 RepID=UPI003F5B2CEB
MEAVERLTRLETSCRQVEQDVKALKGDYYDSRDRVGIRTRVLILWYSYGAIAGAAGTLLGYFLRGVFPS